MQLYTLVTFIICLAGLMAFINQKWLKMPSTIGIMIVSMVFSVIGSTVGRNYIDFLPDLKVTVQHLHFNELVLHVLLGFLLFAGSFHIDARILKKELLPVAVLSTIGIFITTTVMGVIMFYMLPFLGMPVPLLYCLLFASVVAPTDPIAVLAILKKAGLNKHLEMKIAGESLFNDGVAVVVFSTILSLVENTGSSFSTTGVLLIFTRIALGGLFFGGLLGWVSNFFLKQCKQYEVAILVTVAIVMGGYRLAEFLEVSGPLAMVVAGIMIGNRQRRERGMIHLVHFWEIMDEIFNTILFMLIGLQMILIKFNTVWLLIGLLAIIGLLIARWLSVFIPYKFIKRWADFEQNAVAILTWGGLRGGLSVAMALSLPSSNNKDVFVTVTYVIVVFSIIVQGLSIGKFYSYLTKKTRQQ